MEAFIYRHAYLPNVTLGRLIADTLILATLEEPWIPSALGPGGQSRGLNRRESCVPDGDYTLSLHIRSKDGARVWVLSNPLLGVYEQKLPDGQKFGRTAVLIHKGNTLEDTEGCILAGLRHGTMSPDAAPAVLESGAAIEQLRAVMDPGINHILHIRPTGGTMPAVLK